MAVVKADGFGHGAEQVPHGAAPRRELAGCHLPGGGASAARPRGITAPILMWLSALEEDLTAVRASVDVSVPSSAHAATVAAAADRGGVRARVHLKVTPG
jgi:alanine racemase